MPEVVAVIPARGGSKGIPLKNLQELAFKPLIEYTIQAALESKIVNRVIVSTDSKRIAEVAERAGAEIPFLRPSHLADDKTPLAAVMRHFLDWCDEVGWSVEALVILEPTSPLRTSANIDEAVELFREKKADTVVSVKRNTSLLWVMDDGSPRPIQTERLNRQLLKPVYQENGAIFVTKPEVVTESTTIGDRVVLYEMSPAASIDINTWADFRQASLALRSIKIMFHFKATAELGFGHFYRVLTLANRLHYNDVVLLCSEFDDRAAERLGTVGFRYYLSQDPVQIIRKERPTILVNDILDTSKSLMQQLRGLVPLTVNFEDLGEGSQLADLVFNALYRGMSSDSSYYGGGEFAIMRDEFLFLPKHKVREKLETVTATFGGSDPNNIAYYCMKTLPVKYPEIQFRIIVGPGYMHDKSLLRTLVKKLHNTELIDTATDMAKHFSESDLVITSCGRTVFEAAACGVPCVVMCQNEREMKHRHISYRDGVISLGLFNAESSMDSLVEVLDELKDHPDKRREMSERSSGIVDGLGVFRVIGLIEKAARARGLIRSF
ncbi:MAG: cytidylyltransferase domain-containing protein [Candidatus Thorarchaeota archaeon]